VREMTTHVLEGLGYEVFAARDGVEAVEIFQREHSKIDLVVLDVMMPRLDGVGTLRALRAIEPSLPALVVSGFGNERARADIEALGVGGFLQKPFTVGDLSQAVSTALRVRHSA
jgi:CheY-like chemotaxis protein